MRIEDNENHIIFSSSSFHFQEQKRTFPLPSSRTPRTTYLLPTYLLPSSTSSSFEPAALQQSGCFLKADRPSQWKLRTPPNSEDRLRTSARMLSFSAAQRYVTGGRPPALSTGTELACLLYCNPMKEERLPSIWQNRAHSSVSRNSSVLGPAAAFGSTGIKLHAIKRPPSIGVCKMRGRQCSWFPSISAANLGCFCEKANA